MSSCRATNAKVLTFVAPTTAGCGRSAIGTGSSAFATVPCRCIGIAWESATGERLGDRYALHTCDEPRCVNPRHLYDGTAKQNMEDMHRRRRWPSRRGELHPLCKLTEDELARLRSTGGTNAEVAARFGLSAGYVSELRRGLRR